MSLHSKGPTLEQLHTTWLRRRKLNWPATFQAAIEHPLFSRILSIETLHCELKRLAPVIAPLPAPHAISSHVTISETGKRRRVGYWMDSQDDDAA